MGKGDPNSIYCTDSHITFEEPSQKVLKRNKAWKGCCWNGYIIG